MTPNKVPAAELQNRLTRFRAAMDATYPDWELCALVGPMNVFWLTGTIFDGMLLLRRDGDAALWARRGYERALLESEFEGIRRMNSFKDVAAANPELPDTLYLDMSFATLEWHAFLSRHMKFSRILPVDAVCLEARAVKSGYELARMREAGQTIDRLLGDEVPGLLREGISEAELGAELFGLFIRNGHHGVSRFSMRNADVVMGHIGFGVSALYPSVFNGASGLVGLCPAAPVLGSREVTLKKGDLVYIDIGFGVDGYQVDTTQIYSFGGPPAEAVSRAQSHCLELERKASDRLRPGAKPCEIYETVLAQVPPELRDCFMGAPGRTVPFLGHGVGLYVDEYPVLAKGFAKPLESGMTLAVEPKVGIEGVGMAGSENTYLVTESGGECLTGMARDIIVIE